MNRPVTSASNIHRRFLCPGSERLEAGLPEEDHPQAAEGKLLHEYDSNPGIDQTFLPTKLQDLLRISEDLDNYVFQRACEQFQVTNNEFEEGREQELVALKNEEGETPGTCDRFRYWPKDRFLVIIDKKFGWKVVTPANANYQLRVYAMGGFEEFEVEDCVVAITQPRLAYGQRVSLAAYDVNQMPDAASELKAIRAASRESDAPLVAGEEQCRYCKAKLICPAFKEKFLPLSTDIKGRTPAAAARSLAECTDEELDKVLVAIQFSDFIKESARGEARNRIQDGKFPQWELSKPTAVRKIMDVARAIALLELRGNLTRNEILDCSEPSLTKIEERLRKKCNLTWKDAKKILNETLDSVIELEQKRPKLLRKYNV